MCGRFYIEDSLADAVWKSFPGLDPYARRLFAAGDIRPSEKAPALCTYHGAGGRGKDSYHGAGGRGNSPSVRTLTWGYPNRDGRGLLINARAETVLDKKLFRNDVRNSRCVLPSSGFYEWNAQKDSFCFTADAAKASETPLYLAGFFSPDDRFILLTTAANASMLPVHRRMPLFIPPAEITAWLFDDSALPDFLSRSMPPLHREAFGQTSLF